MCLGCETKEAASPLKTAPKHRPPVEKVWIRIDVKNFAAKILLERTLKQTQLADGINDLLNGKQHREYG